MSNNNATCMPKKPLRCWQYRKDSDEPIPRWLVGAIETGDKGFEFSSPRDETHCILDDGDWIVELETADNNIQDSPYLAVYAPDAFADSFEVRTGE